MQLPYNWKRTFCRGVALENSGPIYLVQKLLFLLTMQLCKIFWRKWNPNQDWLYGSCFYKNLILRSKTKKVSRIMKLITWADYGSRIYKLKKVRETFPDEQMYMLHSSTRPSYADLVNYLVTKEFPSGSSKFQKDKLWVEAKYYF